MTVSARTFPQSGRVSALGADGMVSASHPAISRAGADVLASGGNAVDAALAMAAVAWLALPGQCGIGGDAFALVREPGGAVRSFGGSGFGPDGGTPGFYRAAGGLPRYGALSVAGPGAVAALSALHAAGATRSLEQLWEPAARLATTGLPCTARTRGDIDEHRERLATDPSTASLLRDGRAPAVGTRLIRPELAATIAALSRDPGDLYTGSLAERTVTALVAGGAPFSGDEWVAGGDVHAEEPLSCSYAGHVVHQTPLPTPGWMVLDQLAICDGELGGHEPLGAPAVHWLAGAARIAFDERYRSAGSDRPAPDLRGAADALAAARERIRAGDLPAPAGARPDGDTTSMVAVDADGRAVGLIESLAFTFGAGLAVPGTGIVLNNRLARGAYLVPGHPNEVAPRRRPLHTLNSWIVTDAEGHLRHVGNTPGGDGQVQWNAQLISHLLDHGAGPQDAVDAPRFSVFPGSDAGDLGSPAELRCEDRLGAGVLADLAARGHDVVRAGDLGGGGSAQVVSVDRDTGALAGGADSRQEGVALGV
ncbi:gamma-glutamyltransferase family protein [Pseudonocardia sp. HH130630-07]|uniref:gamma-glutamyltransferase family protein n=1 Tax=Pseudonocardia sp. HH130630-07 TaxID=1690815 RepID=UPI000814C83E|nr:gamma-glutamyltransferase [Pseudonocardia sp. HH130630-07]ANY08822.1 gamma-glutamyltransferase [Pseudonocardia sp. HH130630-07]